METQSAREIRDGTLVIRIEDGATPFTLALSGELDLANVQTLRDELQRAAERNGVGITLDMRKLEFIDSTGIALLVQAHHRLNEDGGENRFRLICSEADGVNRVMAITGLDSVLPFVTPDEGLQT